MLTQLTKRKSIILILVFAFLNLLIYESIITAKSNKTFAPPLIGDVNGDGEVTIEDAELVCKKAAGQAVEVAQPDNGDINRNGVLDAGDALLIGQQVYGIIDLPQPVITMAASMQGDYMVEGIARAGDMVHIYGEGLADSSGGSWVLLNDISVYPELQTSGLITFQIPEAMSFDKIKVQTGFVESNELNFTLTDGPMIGTISPAIGEAGTSVTIVGSGFSKTLSENQVYFGNILAEVIHAVQDSANQDTIIVIAPEITDNCNVVVQIHGEFSNHLKYFHNYEGILDPIKSANNEQELKHAYIDALDGTRVLSDDVDLVNSYAEIASELEMEVLKIGDYFDYLISIQQELLSQGIDPFINPDFEFATFKHLLQEDLLNAINDPTNPESVDLLLFIAPQGEVVSNIEITRDTYLTAIQVPAFLNWIIKKYSAVDVNGSALTKNSDSMSSNDCMRRRAQSYHKKVQEIMNRYALEVALICEIRKSQILVHLIVESVLVVATAGLSSYIKAVEISTHIAHAIDFAHLSHILALLGKETYNTVDEIGGVEPEEDVLLAKAWEDAKWKWDEALHEYMWDIEKCIEPEFTLIEVEPNCVLPMQEFFITMNAKTGHTPTFVKPQYTAPYYINSINQIKYEIYGDFIDYGIFHYEKSDFLETADKVEAHFAERIPSIPKVPTQDTYWYNIKGTVQDVGFDEDIKKIKKVLHVNGAQFEFGELPEDIYQGQNVDINIYFYGHDRITGVDNQKVKIKIDCPDNNFDRELTETTQPGGKIELTGISVGTKHGTFEITADTEYICPYHQDKKPNNIKGSLRHHIGKPGLELFIAPTGIEPVKWEKRLPLVGQPDFQISGGSGFYDIPSRPYSFKAVLTDAETNEPISGEKIHFGCAAYPEIEEFEDYTNEVGEVFWESVVFPGQYAWAIRTKEPIVVTAYRDGAEAPFEDDEYDEVHVDPTSHAPKLWMDGLLIKARDYDGDITALHIGVERVDPLEGGYVYLSTPQRTLPDQDDPNTIWNETVWQATYICNLSKVSVIFTVIDDNGNRTPLPMTFVAP